LDEVEFDLGLGKDLDHTIAEAMKVAHNKSKGEPHKPGETTSHAGQGERRPSLGASIPVPPTAATTQEMPELPLPAEAAQLLSEARQAVVNCRVVPKSKTGRKASMGMGLFKETAEVKLERDTTRGDASKSRTPVIEEEDPYEDKRTHSLRGQGDAQELDAAALRDQLEHHFPEPSSSASLASTVRPKLRGMGSGASDQVRKPVSGSMTPTRERERTRLLGHHLGARVSGQLEPTEPTPSHRKLGISPAVSRHTSRAASPTVLNSELDHHEWSSDGWWETSSGVSSSAESEAYDEEHEEEYFARGPRRDVPPGQVKDPQLHSRGRSHDRDDAVEESEEHLLDLAEARHRQAGGEMTIPLQPFNNKVGGHSEIYKFTRRAVCKVSVAALNTCRV
jgi:hypothetical protein